MRILVLLWIFIFCAEHSAWAAAAQMIQQRKQMEAATMERAIIERQMTEQIVRRMAAQKAQQIAQQMDQQTIQQMNQQFAQQMVDQLAQQIGQQAAQQMVDQIIQQTAQQVAQQAFEKAAQEGINVDQDVTVTATFNKPRQKNGEEYVAEMADVLKSLETSSKAWSLIIDKEPKAFILSKYIDSFKTQGIVIKKSAEDYINILDSMAAQDPAMLNNPFKNVFQLVAILEYDFDNGQNKDKMIINLIGKEAYLQNKERLGLP